MSTPAPHLDPRALEDLVCRVIADVLMVSRQEVQPDSALVRDLGAESIDFLDLVFRLEEALHTRIGVDRWDRYVRDHLPGAPLSTAITTRFVCGFARAQLSPGERHPAAW